MAALPGVTLVSPAVLATMVAAASGMDTELGATSVADAGADGAADVAATSLPVPLVPLAVDVPAGAPLVVVAAGMPAAVLPLLLQPAPTVTTANKQHIVVKCRSIFSS
jgi:hypothetical protein